MRAPRAAAARPRGGPIWRLFGRNGNFRLLPTCGDRAYSPESFRRRPGLFRAARRSRPRRRLAIGRRAHPRHPPARVQPPRPRPTTPRSARSISAPTASSCSTSTRSRCASPGGSRAPTSTASRPSRPRRPAIRNSAKSSSRSSRRAPRRLPGRRADHRARERAHRVRAHRGQTLVRHRRLEHRRRMERAGALADRRRPPAPAVHRQGARVGQVRRSVRVGPRHQHVHGQAGASWTCSARATPCCPDGQLFVAGGHITDDHGLPDANIYTPRPARGSRCRR